METLFSSCGQEPFAQDFLRIVFGQFEVMDARVDRWVAAIDATTAAYAVHFAHDRQTGIEIGQSTGR